jgi:hypothetical protein
LIHVVERDEVPGSLNLGGEFPQKALLPVLRHLRVCWALKPPQRRHQRHAVKTRMAVLPGFDHSYTVFSGASAGLQAETQSWIIENVSLGGLRTCFDESATDRIKLGSLLCMQVEGGENWLLGTARRFNRQAGGRANLGVQLLARQAQSIELRPRRSGFSAAVAIPGIWLHDGEVPGIVRIVLPLGSFSVREDPEFQPARPYPSADTDGGGSEWLRLRNCSLSRSAVTGLTPLTVKVASATHESPLPPRGGGAGGRGERS